MAINNIIIQEVIHPSINGLPIVFQKGQGPFLYDTDNNKYIDFVNGKGAIILGHNPPEFIKEMTDYLASGYDIRTGYSEIIYTLNKQIQEALGFDHLAYFKTGTEAVKAALFTAKSYNGRNIVLSSGYHGYDAIWKFEGKIGEANTNGIIDFFYDLDLLAVLLSKYRDMISAVIISPDPLYLDDEWFNEFASLIQSREFVLIIDEVKVGFRYNYGLYTDRFGLKPDIAVVSKAISNGFPISVLVGNAEYMQGCAHLSYTSFFDSLTFYATTKVMNIINDKEFYKSLEAISLEITEFIKELINEFALPIQIVQNRSIFQFVFPNRIASDIFFYESTKNGLIFYPGDNQCLSFSFRDQELYSCLKDNFIKLFYIIKKNLHFKTGQEPTLEWKIKTAWNLMDGLPNMPIRSSLKKKMLKQLAN